jgi:hypothetical protein
MEHEASEGDEVKASQDGGQALIVACQAAETSGPGDAALDHPALGQQDKAALGLGQLDHLQADALPLSRRRRLLAGGLVDRDGQQLHLRAVLGISWGDVQGEQVPQRVDGSVQLGATASLVAVVARPPAALGRRVQRLAVQDGRTGLAGAPRLQAQQGAQVVHDRLKDTRVEPAARLLVDDVPAGKVVRQHAPLGASAHPPAQAIEDLAQVVAPLRRVLTYEGQVGRDEVPFLVADVTLRGGARRWSSHVPILPTPRHRVHNRL